MIVFQKERVAAAPPKPSAASAGAKPAPARSGRRQGAKTAPAEALRPEPAHPEAPREASAAAWRVLPLGGRYEIAYADAFGRPSRRRLNAAELKVGPGKLLLGGVDADLDAYRGFRVDRIRALKALETGEVVGRNIVDWLLAQADRLARKQRRAALAASKPAKARLAQADATAA